MGRFARYELLDLVGVGGMAEVFAARGYRSDGSVRELVLKRIVPELAGEADFQEMLLEEARVTAMLQHPKIVRTLDWGRLDDTCFIAMERVVGTDGRGLLMESEMRRERIPADVALFIVSEVLDALAYAHTVCDENGDPLGIVHRDVSPANVLISMRGEVKLADFGIARAKLRASHTQVGQVRGKPRYMSPEQARGETIDARSNVFAAGLLLYEFLTGVPALAGGETIEEVISGLDQDVPPPSRLVSDLPPGIDALVLGMCDRKLAARYASASVARKALDGVARRRNLRLDGVRLAELVRAFMAPPPEDPPSVTRVLRVDDVAGSVLLTTDRPIPANLGPATTADLEDRTRVRLDPGPLESTATTLSQAGTDDRTEVRPNPATATAREDDDRTRVRQEPAPVTDSYFDELLEGTSDRTASLENIRAPIRDEPEAGKTGTQKNPVVKRSRPAPEPEPEPDDVGIPPPPWFALPIILAVLAIAAVAFNLLKTQ